jgi:Tol biopolymer transport system component
MNARVIIIPILIAICLIGCRPQATPTEPYQEGGSEIAKGHYPRISPDGKAITSTRDNTIYVADTNGLNEKMIFRVRLYSQLLQWSSDGSRIGFIEADTVHWLNNRIVSIDIQTKERKILTPSIGVVRYI